MNTVSHAGDTGDLIGACASFGAMGGDIDLVLYPAPGMVREPMTPKKVDQIRPLLMQQEYIKQVRYSDVPEGRVLDDWRKWSWGRLSLIDMFAKWAGVALPDRNTPWLKVDGANFQAPIVVHRSPRYRNRSRFPWRLIAERYGRQNIVVVGAPDEYDSLNHDCNGGLRYYPTADLLELARVIQGCELYIGNQSMPYHVALGLMRPLIWLQQDRDRKGNCYWQREGMYFDKQVRFPELPKWSSMKCESPHPAGHVPEIVAGRVVNLDRIGLFS